MDVKWERIQLEFERINKSISFHYPWKRMSQSIKGIKVFERKERDREKDYLINFFFPLILHIYNNSFDWRLLKDNISLPVEVFHLVNESWNQKGKKKLMWQQTDWMDSSIAWWLRQRHEFSIQFKGQESGQKEMKMIRFKGRRNSK